jgi:hypothetical protein
MLLYRYIKAGKLSRTPDGLIDTAELLRAGLLLQTSDVTPPVTPLHDVTPLPVTPETPVTRPVTEAVTSAVTPPVSAETNTLERLIDVLQWQSSPKSPLHIWIVKRGSSRTYKNEASPQQAAGYHKEGHCL